MTTPSSTPTPTPTTPIGRHPLCGWMVLIFRCFGIWHTARSSLAYRAYAVALHLVFTVLYTVAMCAGLWAQRTLVDRITASGMTLTLVALNVKLANLYAHMRTVQRVLEDSERFQVHNDVAGGGGGGGVDAVVGVELRLVRGGQRRFAAVLCAYYAMANAAGVAAYVSAWSARKLPFAARYGGLLAVSTDAAGGGDIVAGERSYAVAYAFQVAGMLMLSALNITMELFLSYLMHLMTARMRVIGGRLERIGWRRMAADGDEDSAKQCRRHLIECVRAHQCVMRYASMWTIALGDEDEQKIMRVAFAGRWLQWKPHFLAECSFKFASAAPSSVFTRFC